MISLQFVAIISWKMYIFTSKQNFIVYIGTIIDLSLLILIDFLILKYYKFNKGFSIIERIKNEKNKFIEIILIIFGSSLVAFAISNIHSCYNIAEGGQLGVELLMYNWLGISPAISCVIIDLTVIIISFFILGKKFFGNAIFGTISYSIFYYVFEKNYFLPDLSNNLLLASIIGGILVGIGCGIVVRNSGACGGDDSLALMLNKITKINLSICYFILDFIIIVLSLSYISLSNIIYSLLTALISSLIIGLIYDKK